MHQTPRCGYDGCDDPNPNRSAAAGQIGAGTANMDMLNPMAMTPRDALRFIAKHGVVLEAARGPVPSLVEAALGRRPRGSWWGHPRGKEFFWLTRAVRASRDVLVCRLVSGKVTYVHRRLWPALARLERRFGQAALRVIQEVHTSSGAHRVALTPFRKLVPRSVLTAGAKLTEQRALAALGSWTGGLTPH